MTMLDNLPVGPRMRSERGDADKSVIGTDVRGADATMSARFSQESVSGRLFRGRRHVYRRAGAIWALSASAMVLMIALVASPALRANDGARGRVVAPAPLGRKASSWRLVSDLSPSWRALPSSKFEPGDLPAVTFDCPTTTTCYVGNFASSGAGTSVEVEVSHDSGATWRLSALPVALARPPSLFCLDADTCAILGIDGSGDSTFLETNNGGQAWSVHPGPDGLTPLVGPDQLACTSAMSCLAVASGPYIAVGHVGAGSAYVTENGGVSWSTSSEPSGFFPNTLQCTSVGTCVESGFQSPNGTLERTGGTILYTTDEGSNWTVAVVPSGLSAFNSLSCADMGNCIAIFSGVGGSSAEVLTSVNGGKTWTGSNAAGSLAHGVVMSLSCPDARECWATGVKGSTGGPGTSWVINLQTAPGFAGFTSDNGKTWQDAQLPRGVGAVLDISCPTASSCYAVSLKQVQGGSGTAQSFELLAYGNAP